jgi:hypothetical protein
VIEVWHNKCLCRQWRQPPYACMKPHELMKAITTLVYRLAIYANNNLIDDPAMLAFVFC